MTLLTTNASLESSNNTAAGFYFADYGNIKISDYNNWISPGDYYYRVKYGKNFNGSPANEQEINAAVTEWESLQDYLRWSIRMHHAYEIGEGGIRKNRAGSKQYVYFQTFLPLTVSILVSNYNVQNEFIYLGSNFTTAKQTFLTFSDLPTWLEFWPSDVMDDIIFGYEAAML